MRVGHERRERAGRRLGAVLALAALVAVTGCTGSDGKWRGGKDDKGDGSGKPPLASAAITAPTDGATDVPASTEIVFTGTNATTTNLTVTDATGTAVTGALRPDGSSWVPAAQLKYGTEYSVKVEATGTDGRTDTKTAKFTTMAKPASLVNINSFIGDGQVVGVGMPLVLNFGVDVPKDLRASVQKRLFVTSDPPQEGGFNWFNAKEVHFRPKEHWQPGTKLTARYALGGLPFGGKWYGRADVTVTATVGSKVTMEVDDATKQMTVTKDGQVLRTIPVSLGKPSTPSSSGNMIIMTKNPWEWFDSSTYGVPADSREGYRTKVQWPMRITWGGQYLHAAPWSERQQGRTNVSHGCLNISMANAEWLYNTVHVGDPVTVKNTPRPLEWSDGFTDWNVSFEQYVKGSAIPYTPPTAPASPSTSAEPTPTPS